MPTPSERLAHVEAELELLRIWADKQRKVTCPVCEGYPQYHRPCRSCRGTGRRLYEKADDQIGDAWYDFDRRVPIKERVRTYLRALLTRWMARL